MPKNVKLNRRSVATQSELQVGVSDARRVSSRKHLDVNGKFSSLCKKSAYRNLLQRSITVDAHGRVNLLLDFINSGRSRATQTLLNNENELCARVGSGQEESLEIAIPMQARSPEVSLTPSLLSNYSSSTTTTNNFRYVKVRYEDRPGTSTLVRADSSSLQIDEGNASVEGSVAVIYSCDDRESIHSRVSLMVHTYDNQPSIRGQSNEAVLLVQDYQSYDVMNAARRVENRRRRRCCSRSKRKKRKNTERPVAIYPEASVQTMHVCRICHEGEEVEPLIRPCLCKGSVGYIHVKCLKTWLEQSNTSRCEICGYPYTITQSRKYRKCYSVVVFMQNVVDRRALMYDLISFFAVTPLCIIGIAMCVRASIVSGSTEPVPGTNFQMGNVTRAGMIMLTTTIVVAYTVWLYTLMSYHYKSWKRWYNSCYEVEVIPVNLSSEERLETVERLEEERRRRSSRANERGSLATVVEANSSYNPYTNFFQRRLFASGRVQSLPQ